MHQKSETNSNLNWNLKDLSSTCMCNCLSMLVFPTSQSSKSLAWLKNVNDTCILLQHNRVIWIQRNLMLLVYMRYLSLLLLLLWLFLVQLWSILLLVLRLSHIHTDVGDRRKEDLTGIWRHDGKLMSGSWWTQNHGMCLYTWNSSRLPSKR